MPKRLSYEESCRVLQGRKIIAEGEIPQLPDGPPRYDETHGVRFFRTMLADAKIQNMTLRRTFFGRSEIRDTSFKGTDLWESTANWNNFIGVDFSGADLSSSDLRACLFERVRFKDAILAGVDFRYCGFKECNFSGADLTDAKLIRKAGMALGLTPEQQNVIDWQTEDGEEPVGG